MTKFWAETLLVSFLILTTATACSLFATPKGFDQQLAYAYSTETALLDAAANAVTVGTLSVTDAEQVVKIADQVKLMLDTAKGLAVTGDLDRAEAQLELALNVMKELQVYVNKKALK